MGTTKKVRDIAARDNDLVDQLVAEWEEEAPELDASAMSVVGRIMRLGRQFELDAEAALKPFGLSYTEFDIIATIRRKGPPYTMLPSRICDLVILSSGAMTAALDRLESNNLVKRVADSNDRRVKAAKLTKTGIRISDKAAAARFRVARLSLAELTDKGIDSLRLQLKKLGSSDRR